MKVPFDSGLNFSSYTTAYIYERWYPAIAGSLARRWSLRITSHCDSGRPSRWNSHSCDMRQTRGVYRDKTDLLAAGALDGNGDAARAGTLHLHIHKAHG